MSTGAMLALPDSAAANAASIAAPRFRGAPAPADRWPSRHGLRCGRPAGAARMQALALTIRLSGPTIAIPNGADWKKRAKRVARSAGLGRGRLLVEALEHSHDADVRLRRRARSGRRASACCPPPPDRGRTAAFPPPPPCAPARAAAPHRPSGKTIGELEPAQARLGCDAEPSGKPLVAVGDLAVAHRPRTARSAHHRSDRGGAATPRPHPPPAPVRGHVRDLPQRQARTARVHPEAARSA